MALKELDNSNNGWNEWSRHVLSELERQNAHLEKLEKQLGEIQIELTRQVVKAGFLGALTGMLPGIVAILWFLLKK